MEVAVVAFTITTPSIVANGKATIVSAHATYRLLLLAAIACTLQWSVTNADRSWVAISYTAIAEPMPKLLM